MELNKYPAGEKQHERNTKLNEDDIYKDAPGLDSELEWAEEDHWIKKLIIKEKIKKAVEKLVLINAEGTVRNLLITDDKPDFLFGTYSVE